MADPALNSSSFRSILSGVFGRKGGDVVIALGVLIIVMMLIIPLPPVLLDLLMTVNLLLSLLIILLVLYNSDPLEFSLFPTVLLISTVFGLALNVSSTRLILRDGANFSGAIVRAFATFVVGAKGQQGLVIGFIIFIILVAVQFMVITKGATRVSEVAARFALDGLPAKQMAIDSELSSGAITEEESRIRKKHLDDSVNFYGSMDGATKFISGTVKVSIVITLINIVGGIIVGTTIHGEALQDALITYVSLTIGDGLVAQVPTLLVSVATGLIVTRAANEGSFSQDAHEQFARQSQIYFVAAGFLALMGILPGFPWYLMFPLAALTGWVGFRLSRKTAEKLEAQEAEAGAAPGEPQEISPVVPLDPISLELGFGLIPLVDKDQGAELLERVTRIRKEAALDLGLVVPRIRIMDNMRLEPSEYAFKLRGTEVGRGTIRMGHFMAINPGGERETLEGEPTSDPAFGLPATWIVEDSREKAERAGYTVVDGPSIIATHLTEILKHHADEILGRQEIRSMLDVLKEDYPAVVDEVTKAFTLGEIQKILQGLLSEQVSIRNLVAILETIGDFASVSKDTGFLVEKTRQSLRRQICLQYADENKKISVLTIEPSVEKTIIDSRTETISGDMAALEPKFHRAWINAVANSVKTARDSGAWPVILCSESARPLVRSTTVREMPDLVVLSVPEIAEGISIDAIGEIRMGET
ncbi:MAG: flagellar biosynthesis protein FlhA [Spirochaetales bacterium]|nr:MAG: flagellar biosynthesis protein FlhA [Spirochaetales bacterium]